MEVVIKDCADSSYVVEVGEDATMETMRQKVASAVGFPEDSFRMGFGGKEEGEDITELSAGDTIVLTMAKVKKYEAVAALRALGVTEITARKLETVLSRKNAAVACLLLQAEVVTVIPKLFLAYTTLATLDLSDVSCVTEICDDFMEACRVLTSVDLSGLCHLTRIGNNFLSNCSSLTIVDMAPLSRVEKIGHGFISKCSSLKVLDLPLSTIEEIGHAFLYNCGSLTAVDLPPLCTVTQIGTSFLSNCSSLTVLDLPLGAVTEIGSLFLSHCSSLTELDLSALNRVVQIGHNFLSKCSSLTELNFSPLSSVMYMGVLPDCDWTSLRSIHLSGCSSALSSIVRESAVKDLVVEET